VVSLLLSCSEEYQEVPRWKWSEISVKDRTNSVEWYPIILRAMENWNYVSKKYSFKLTTGNANVDIVVGEGEWKALSELWVSSNNYIWRGRITLNPINLGDYRVTEVGLLHIFCHEFGHILGLGHHRGNSCMNNCLADDDYWLCTNDVTNSVPSIEDRKMLISF
jgi:predicted Zn-dependent protease